MATRKQTARKSTSHDSFRDLPYKRNGGEGQGNDERDSALLRSGIVADSKGIKEKDDIGKSVEKEDFVTGSQKFSSQSDSDVDIGLIGSASKYRKFDSEEQGNQACENKFSAEPPSPLIDRWIPMIDRKLTIASGENIKMFRESHGHPAIFVNSMLDDVILAGLIALDESNGQKHGTSISRRV